MSSGPCLVGHARWVMPGGPCLLGHTHWVMTAGSHLPERLDDSVSTLSAPTKYLVTHVGSYMLGHTYWVIMLNPR